MAVAVDTWMVKAMVSTLTTSPDSCIVLGAVHWPKKGQPRVRAGGRRVHLVRYLYDQTHDEPLPLETALIPGGCRTIGCLNPNHRIQSRRRTLPKRKDTDS